MRMRISRTRSESKLEARALCTAAGALACHTRSDFIRNNVRQENPSYIGHLPSDRERPTPLDTSDVTW